MQPSDEQKLPIFKESVYRNATSTSTCARGTGLKPASSVIFTNNNRPSLPLWMCHRSGMLIYAAPVSARAGRLCLGLPSAPSL